MPSETTAMPPEGMAPVMEGAVASRLSYHRLLRLIQVGDVRGARCRGKWFVDVNDALRWARSRQPKVEAASA